MEDYSDSEHRAGDEHQDEGGFQKWLKYAHDSKPGGIVILPFSALNLLLSTAQLRAKSSSRDLTQMVGQERFSSIYKMKKCASPG